MHNSHPKSHQGLLLYFHFTLKDVNVAHRGVDMMSYLGCPLQKKNYCYKHFCNACQKEERPKNLKLFLFSSFLAKILITPSHFNILQYPHFCQESTFSFGVFATEKNMKKKNVWKSINYWDGWMGVIRVLWLGFWYEWIESFNVDLGENLEEDEKEF